MAQREEFPSSSHQVDVSWRMGFGNTESDGHAAKAQHIMRMC